MNSPCDDLTDGDRFDSPPGDGYPRIRVESDEHDHEHVQAAVEVLRQFDEDAPARIRISVMNDSDETRTLVFGVVRPFQGLVSGHEEKDTYLTLFPEDLTGVGVDRDDIPDEPAGRGCWRYFGSYPTTRDFFSETGLSPCETVSMEYEVYDGAFDLLVERYGYDPDEVECLAPGRYRFESPTVGDHGYSWRFTLILGDE